MILWKQAVRGMWRNKRAYLACVVLMGLGISLFIAYSFLYRNLSAAQQAVYEEYRFGEGFARVAGIPFSAVDRLSEMEGIRQMDATIVADARLMKEDSPRIITLRLASFDPEEESRLNNFILTAGTPPREEGILLGEAFAEANGFSIGDEVPLVLGGQRLAPLVTGLVQSPEYIYAIPDTGQLLPDSEAFGFAYLTREQMGRLTGGAGATHLSFLLEEGASFAQLRYPLEDALAPYGLLSLIERQDQPSHSMLQMEIDSLGTMSTSFPMVFVLISVVILYIMMKRIIEQERGQVGTMKAFGFSNGTILLHYLSYGLVTGALGGLFGVSMGWAMTGPLTETMLMFFSLPAIQVPPDPRLLGAGLLIALASGALGAFMGVRGMIRLSPAEAMRPPSPPAVKGDWVGRLPLLRRILDSFGFMAVRNIARGRLRSLFVVAGLSVAFALSALMASYFDLFDAIMLDRFTKVEQFNLRIELKRPEGATAAVEAAYALPGVRRAEGVLTVPVELRSGHLRESTLLTALEEDSGLYHLYDSEKKADIPPPKEGIALDQTLAQKLGVARGDLLTLRTPYTGEEDFVFPVMEVVHTNLGSGAYTRIDGLWKQLNLPPSVTGLILDAEDADTAKRLLLEARNVSSITDKEEMARIYTDLLDSYSLLIYMMQLAGLGIAFAIITNTAAISLSERKREYATMRVLGMHPAEIGRVIGFEYYLLAVLAFFPGVGLTGLLKRAMAKMIESDMFSMPLKTPLFSYGVAAAVCLFAVALSNRTARRKIARFDMVEVLKERE